MGSYKIDLWEKIMRDGVNYWVIRVTGREGEQWLVVPEGEKYSPTNAHDAFLSVAGRADEGVQRPVITKYVNWELEDFTLENIVKQLREYKSMETTELVDKKENKYYLFGGPFLTENGEPVPTATKEKKPPTEKTEGVATKTPPIKKVVPKPLAQKEEITPKTYWRSVNTGTGGRVEVYVDGAGQIPSALLTFSINPIKGTWAIYKGMEGTQFNFETTEPSGDKKLWGARFNINTGNIDWYYWNESKNDWVATSRPGTVEVSSTFSVGWEKTELPGGKSPTGVFKESMDNAPEWLRKKMATKIRS